MTPDTLDALATLRVQAGRGEPFRRDLERLGVALELPAPGATARVLDLFPGATLLRRGATVVLPDGSVPSWTLQEVAERLVDSWAALPDRADAGRSYRDLRLVAVEARGVALEYALQVVGAWRDALEPAPEEERPRRARRPRTPDRTRKRASRERLREDEEVSSRWALEGLLSGDWTDGAPPAPGSRVRPATLHRRASREVSTVVEDREETLSGTPPEPDGDEDAEGFRERLRAWEERDGSRTPEERLQGWEAYAEEWGYPLRPRVPGRSLFYGVADEVLGKRRTLNGRDVYTIPDTRGGTMPDTITHEEITEALEIREIVRALRDHKRRHATRRDGSGRYAATGTGGAVVDLDSRRPGS